VTAPLFAPHGRMRGWPFPDCDQCAADYWASDRMERFDQWSAEAAIDETAWIAAQRYYRKLHEGHLA
jgi:hypothetical protein